MLRQASEKAIRSGHHRAVLEHKSDRGVGTLAIFSLSLGSCQVFYSLDSKQVMIRGYAWDLDHEPRDDFDGGGFYADATRSTAED